MSTIPKQSKIHRKIWVSISVPERHCEEKCGGGTKSRPVSGEISLQEQRARKVHEAIPCLGPRPRQLDPEGIQKRLPIAAAGPTSPGALDCSGQSDQCCAVAARFAAGSTWLVGRCNRRC